jgi:NADH dehydrogenase
MILVVGATGSLGGAIAQSLLADGRRVRVLVRPHSSYDDLVQAGAEAALGDLKDSESLRSACSGIDTVITTATAVGRGGEDTIDSVDLHGNQHLIDAAKAEGVGRFVFTSVLGASPESPVPLIRAKGLAEQRLTSSGMDWVILQPNLYMDTWVPMVVGAPLLAGDPVTLVAEGRRRHSMVAMRDVVAYALAALDHEAATNQRLIVGGPDAISWRDVLAVFERVLGREVPVRSVPLGQPVEGLPAQVNALFHGLETYDSPLDMRELSGTYGVEPTSIRQFVEGFLSTVQPAQRNAG